MEKNPLQTLIKDGGYTAIFRTLGVVGDSLSSGEHEGFDGSKPSYNDYYEYSWGQFIARKCGLQVQNISVGGLTAKSAKDYIGYTHSLVPERACQGYIIALGRNDQSQWNKYENGFGSIDDVDWNDYNNNKDSFVGHYVKIIQMIRNLQPKARIFVVTMPDSEADSTEVKQRCDMHAEFLRTLPNHFEFLYVIDLRKYAPIHDKEFVETYYCGGHLNAMGYIYTAEQISTYIDYIIRNNPKDFTQVAFIGKKVYNKNEKW